MKKSIWVSLLTTGLILGPISSVFAAQEHPCPRGMVYCSTTQTCLLNGVECFASGPLSASNELLPVLERLHAEGLDASILEVKVVAENRIKIVRLNEAGVSEVVVVDNAKQVPAITERQVLTLPEVYDHVQAAGYTGITEIRSEGIHFHVEASAGPKCETSPCNLSVNKITGAVTL